MAILRKAKYETQQPEIPAGPTAVLCSDVPSVGCAPDISQFLMHSVIANTISETVIFLIGCGDSQCIEQEPEALLRA